MRAKLPTGKLAARRREFEAEFESARVQKGSRCRGSLFAKAEHLRQPTQEERGKVSHVIVSVSEVSWSLKNVPVLNV